MPPKKDPSILEELIRALQDDAVLAAIGDIFGKRLLAMSAEIAELKTDNLGLRCDLIAANQRIEALEAYSKHAGLDFRRGCIKFDNNGCLVV